MEREYIGKIKETAEIGRKSYSENLEKILKKEIVELRDTLKQCVSEHAKEEEFGLIISNDASSKIELYEMVDRVKSPESLEEKIIRKEINSENFLATKVIMLLNKGDKCKYWTNGIIIDVNSSSRVGCIGFKSFLESISSICKRKLDEYGQENLPNNFKDKCDVLYDLADEVYIQLSECWNCVFEKWPLTIEQWLVEGDENILTYYNKDYYLQRTMGAFAINKLIAESIKDGNSIDQFKEIIELCDLRVEDWRVDGQFAGISSLSGANKIKEKVLMGYNTKKNNII